MWQKECVNLKNKQQYCHLNKLKNAKNSTFNRLYLFYLFVESRYTKEVASARKTQEMVNNGFSVNTLI